MRTIVARFKSKCAETGRTIRKGETCLYDQSNRQVFCLDSQKYKSFTMNEEADNVRAYVQAQEDAYFDRFCRDNDI